MSLPLPSQNTHHYLQAGYGLACAVASTEASTEMALFAEALSLRLDRFGALSFALRHTRPNPAPGEL
jgi:hypothetical protein